MALAEINPLRKDEEGSGGLGGLIGKIGGAALGGLAVALAPATFGATLPAALATIGAGSTLGGIGGNLSDTQDKSQVIQPVGQIHAAGQLPEVQLANLADSKKALYQAPDMSIGQKDALAPIYDQASAALKRSLQMGGVG